MAAHSAAPIPDCCPETFPGEQEKALLHPENPEEQQQLLPPPSGVEKEEKGGRWSELDPEEITRRLEKTRRELSNRRKILIRNLPQDSSSQEVHDLLKEYELKYCYVDRNKRTAFVTLLDGEQAQDAIQKLHQYSLREKEITVQLQPTDALLCITNLDPFFTFEEFEDLVRAYGNIERCFLVYGEVTGQSKGYGFVEYMKKDSAAKARLELLGRQLGESTLFAQWMDVNQLTADLIHSKCLSVARIPKEYNDSEELLQTFSSLHKPVFCQFAQDEGSYFGGFAVIEYETAEQAEAVKDASNGLILSGSPVRVSFCAPGAPGRSTLAALIAAQGMNCKKGLLPEPNAVQIMKSFSNPAMLQMLQPQLQMHGGKPVLAVSPGLPCFVNPAVSPAFMQLNKVQQKLDLGNTCNLLLHNISQLYMAQQQLQKIKSSQTNSKPGLLGEAPAALLQQAVGLSSAPPINAEMAHWTEAQKATSLTSAPKSAAGMDTMSFFPSQPVTGLPQNKPSTTAAEETVSGSQTYFQSFPNFSAGALQTGHPQPPSQPKSTNLSLGAVVNNQTSLLGEPPKDFRLSTNPYLNLASVLPGVCLPAVHPKAPYAQQQTGVLGSMLDIAVSQESSLQPTLENYCNYFQQYGDYTQEAIKQWYAYYSQAYNTTEAGKQEDGGTEKIGLAEVYQSLPPEDYYNQASAAAYGDFNSYLQVMPSYYTAAQGAQQLASAQSSQQSHFNKQPWSTEKRGSSYLMSSSETNLMDYASQNSQDTGEHYTDSCFKRKRVY